MTLEQQIQSQVDAIMAQATTLMSKGEREYARGLLDARRRFERLLPEPAPEKAAKAPEPAPVAPEPPQPDPEPPKAEKKILGVF